MSYAPGNRITRGPSSGSSSTHPLNSGAMPNSYIS